METEIFFTPLVVGKKTAPNRFIYQPTETNNCSPDGTPTEETFRVYKKRAEAAPGILFIESVDVSEDCQARSNRMVLKESNKNDFQRLVKEINNISPDTLVMFQLSHAGRLSDSQFKPPLYVYARSESENVMTVQEIHKASEDFIAAALLVDEIGADGVDLKQAHGFLAGDFLHPANMRNDEYGGSFKNRTRFFREVFNAVKKKSREDFIIGSRISSYEGIPGGCGTLDSESVIENLSEMEEYASQLEDLGVDFLNISAGYAAANLEILLPTAVFPEGVYRHFSWTRQIKEKVLIPVIGSGYSHPSDGNNTLAGTDPSKKSTLYFAAKNLNDGIVDFIGLGRQCIADPLFVEKVRTGRESEIKWCSTCSGCGMLLGNNKPIGCTQYEDKFKKIYGDLSL